MEPPIEITKEVAQPPERVFDAFTRAGALRQWFCPKGVECTAAECDPSPGGIFRLRMSIPSQGQSFGLTGVFLYVDAPKSIWYSWRWEDRPGFDFVSKVEVSLKPVEAGTSLQIKHCGFSSSKVRDDHVYGWGAVLENLDAYLAENTASPSTHTR